LRDFVQAVLSSPRLWDKPSSAREAVRLSVSAKLAQLGKRGRWFAEWRAARGAVAWVGAVVDEVIVANESSGRTHFLAGILEGMEATSRDWGHARTRAEEEMVLALAMENGFSNRDERLRLFADVAGCIDEKRLRALDLAVSCILLLVMLLCSCRADPSTQRRGWSVPNTSEAGWCRRGLEPSQSTWTTVQCDGAWRSAYSLPRMGGDVHFLLADAGGPGRSERMESKRRR
jgi:hypothetical protein